MFFKVILCMDMCFFHVQIKNKVWPQEKRDIKRLAVPNRCMHDCWVRFHQRAGRDLTSKSGHMMSHVRSLMMRL